MRDQACNLRPWYLAGLLLLLAFPALSHAQPHGLEVRPGDGERFTREPREIVVVPFSVRNATGRRVTLEPRLVLPWGWRPITPEFPFELAPGQVTVRLVSFMVPETARPGVYPVAYEVRDRKQPAVQSGYTVRVEVTARPEMQLLSLDVPDQAIAGESYEATFLVRNTGNARIEVEFEARSIPAGEPTPRTGTVALDPGESRTVPIRVATTEVRRRTRYYLRLIAAVPEAGIRDSVAGATEVVPRLSAVDAYHTLPAQLDLSYVGRDANGERTSGWQAQLSGAGALDEANTRHLSFTLRGPDTRDESSLGTFDEYWIDYRDETIAATLGDQIYGLSPLTELGRYGRGARLGYEKAGWGVSSYHARDRFDATDEEQTALNTYYQVTPDTRLGVNVLDKSGGDFPGRVYGVRSQTLRAAGMSADLELALSDGEGERGQAWHGSFRDDRHAARYYAIGWHADPEFRGYYRDQQYLITGFDYPREGAWGLRGYYRFDHRNLEADPANPAPKEQQLRLGTDRAFASGTRVSLDYRLRRRVDQRPVSEFDLDHRAARLGLNQRLESVSLLYSVELGETAERVSGARFDTALHVFSASWIPGDAQSYSLYATRDDNAFSNEPQRVQTTYGVNANYRLSHATLLNLVAQSSRGETERTRTYNVSLAHQRPGGDRFSLIARRIEGTLPQTDVRLTYTVPLDVPVLPRDGIARVRGRVYDVESGAGLAGVVLDLDGMTAVSGANGGFEFPAVKAGAYRLSIDRGSIDVGKVPVNEIPHEIVVTPNETKQVEIGLVRSVTLSARVKLYADRTRDSGAAFTARGVPHTLVTMKSGDRVYRRLTDAEGRARLAGLTPGKWTVSIAEDAIPEGYEAERRETTLEVGPGATGGAEFALTPVERDMKMLPPLEVKTEVDRVAAR